MTENDDVIEPASVALWRHASRTVGDRTGTSLRLDSPPTWLRGPRYHALWPLLYRYPVRRMFIAPRRAHGCACAARWFPTRDGV